MLFDLITLMINRFIMLASSTNTLGSKKICKREVFSCFLLKKKALENVMLHPWVSCKLMFFFGNYFGVVRFVDV